MLKSFSDRLKAMGRFKNSFIVPESSRFSDKMLKRFSDGSKNVHPKVKRPVLTLVKKNLKKHASSQGGK